MRDLTRTDTGRLANRASGAPVGQVLETYAYDGLPFARDVLGYGL